jgi:hypothetical protein
VDRRHRRLSAAGFGVRRGSGDGFPGSIGPDRPWPLLPPGPWRRRGAGGGALRCFDGSGAHGAGLPMGRGSRRGLGKRPEGALRPAGRSARAEGGTRRAAGVDGRLAMLEIAGGSCRESTFRSLNEARWRPPWKPVLQEPQRLMDKPLKNRGKFLLLCGRSWPVSGSFGARVFDRMVGNMNGRSTWARAAGFSPRRAGRPRATDGPWR